MAEGFTEISTQKPNCDISSPDSGENAQSSNNTKITSTSKDSKKAKSSSKVSTISELEERLAALKGVPVDVVRNPGLVCLYLLTHISYLIT